MKIWIKTLTKDQGRFSIIISATDEVQTIKYLITNYLTQKGKQVSSEQHLVYKGLILDDKKTLANILKEGDQCLFLYNLKEKIQEQKKEGMIPIAMTIPPKPEPPSAENFIDSIIMDSSQFLAQQGLDSEDLELYEEADEEQGQDEEEFIEPQIPVVQQENQEQDQNDELNTHLATLTSMGFPEVRARKALILNLFDPEAALEWILLHDTDPDIDVPFTPDQEAYLISITRQRQSIGRLEEQMHARLEAEQQQKKQQVAECIKNNKCTYTVTGVNYAPQYWYYCFTCGLCDREGVCESCAVVCHKGHTLSAKQHSQQFYCDCGAGSGAKACMCCK